MVSLKKKLISEKSTDNKKNMKNFPGGKETVNYPQKILPLKRICFILANSAVSILKHIIRPSMFLKGSVHGFLKGSVHGFLKSSVHGFLKVSVHGFLKGSVHGFLKGSVHGFLKGSVHWFLKVHGFPVYQHGQKFSG